MDLRTAGLQNKCFCPIDHLAGSLCFDAQSQVAPVGQVVSDAKDDCELLVLLTLMPWSAEVPGL